MELRTTSIYHGTPPYAAPEITNRLPCNMSVDTFAFGIVLWEISTVKLCPGRESETMHSYEAMVMKEAKKDIQWHPPEFYKDFPTTLREIIRQCWDKDPMKRPCMKDVHAKLKDFQETLVKIL